MPGEFDTRPWAAALSDASVIVADPAAKRLVRTGVDRRVEPIGRVGDGPGEYRAVGRIAALGGDTVVMRDPQRHRWLTIVAGRVVAPRGGDRDAMPSGAIGDLSVGGDVTGQLVVERPSRDPASRPSKSAAIGVPTHLRSAVIRLGRNGRPDGVVATLNRSPTDAAVVARSVDGITTTYFLPSLLRGHDAAAHCADGWTAVVRHDPYRAEWIDPRGQRTEGAVRSAPSRRVTPVAQAAAIRARFGERIGAMLAPGDFPPWPPSLPPFDPGTPPVCHQRLGFLVRTDFDERSETMWDVFDRRGELTTRLVLPARTVVVGPIGDGLLVAQESADDGTWRVGVARMP